MLVRAFLREALLHCTGKQYCACVPPPHCVCMPPPHCVCVPPPHSVSVYPPYSVCVCPPSPTVCVLACSLLIILQAEIVHLKQRLSESRAATVRLEVTCAQLRTEGARLLGSQQALATIRQQLLTENTSLDKGQRSFKETWEREKDDMKNHVLSLRNELHQTRQLVSSREMHSVRLVSMETELNLSKQTVIVIAMVTVVIIILYNRRCQVLSSS